MSQRTYQVWNGEQWTFEQIVENLYKLVRSIVAKTTPEELIDDCLQDAWLRLYERLEADPDALRPNPQSKSPAHTRSYYVNRLVWDAHKGSGFGPLAEHYHNCQIPESVAFRSSRKLDKYKLGDIPGLDTVLFADEHHCDWMEEADVRMDLDWAALKFLGNVKSQYLPRYAMAILCLVYDVPYEQGAVVAGCCKDSIFRAVKESRVVLQTHLRQYARAG